jgi:hypothetical protein
MPAKDVIELMAWLKANPNKASAGVIVVGYRLVADLGRATPSICSSLSFRQGQECFARRKAENSFVLSTNAMFLCVAQQMSQGNGLVPQAGCP